MQKRDVKKCVISTWLMFLTSHGTKASSQANVKITIPNEMYHPNLESTQPAASCFPCPDDAPAWTNVISSTWVLAILPIPRS